MIKWMTVGVLYMLISHFKAGGDFTDDLRQWKISYPESEFCEDYKYWYRHYCSKQLTDAENKAEEITSHSEKRAAIEIVYIYTYRYPSTYKTANAFMRGDSVDSANRDVFEKYIDLLKKSYEILCDDYCRSPAFVFRGQEFIPSSIGSSYTFESFTSTSLKMTTAQNFANHKIIFKINSVTGLALETLTAIPGENEILVKPPLKMSVDIHLNENKDQSKIEEHIRDNNGDDLALEVYIEGKMVTNDKIVHSQVGTSDGSIIHETFTYLLVGFTVGYRTLTVY